MTKSEVIRYIILRSIGNFLLLFALFGVFATFGPSLYFEIQFRINQAQGVHYTVADVGKDASGFTTTPEKKNTGSFSQLSKSNEHVLMPKDTVFSILIPKIGASAKIFPNVDSSNSDVFLPILSKGVAHAAGTVFPGANGNIYLFAHSTDNFWDVGRYNAVFYLLKDLSVGDDVVVFYLDTRYNYKVVDSRIVDASDVSYITQGQNQTKETLILQTCWPPGTTWKRLLVFAQRN